MAIQTRQQPSGWKIGLWRIVGVTVGVVAVSVALVAGGLGWQDVRTPQASSEAPSVDAHLVVAQQQAQRYLLGGHGELVEEAPNTQAPARLTAASPALIGTGSAYDGMPYRAAATVPVIATCRGSYPVVEGQHIMYRPRCQ
jgi:hypothetical protein